MNRLGKYLGEKTLLRRIRVRALDTLEGLSSHRGKIDDWPMVSPPKDVLNDSFVCYQDLSEYVGLENIERGFHGEPALKKHY